uniref:Uncharacterized protein n=1 Tax=Avena sativa TaxID=4498 RepID=A0ACD5WEB7_AVESA
MNELSVFPSKANSNQAYDKATQQQDMVSSMKLSVTFLLLVSGLVVFGEIEGAAAQACAVVCFQGGHITCDNYPGQELDGCDCECAPADGKGCVLHLDDGVTHSNCN